jgi:hypothetical protein
MDRAAPDRARTCHSRLRSGDWTTETLTLVDVTGAWEGSFYFATGREFLSLWVLQQNRAKVRGEVQGPDGRPTASIEGFVNVELLNWTLTGPS